MTEPENLPPIDRIFRRLHGVYLAQWDRMIGGAPMGDVKTTWEHELSGFLQNREAMMAIAWALENLPERCPNVIEFKNLCRMAPALDVPRLDEPKADPERVRAQLEKLAPLREKIISVQAKDCREWDRVIMANPKGRTPTVIQMAKNALGMA
jgi:hypothetical protein